MSGRQSIKAIEDAALISGAIYYSDLITVGQRNGWHQQALEILKKVDIVFLDPDNGMLVKPVGKQSARSVKYAFYEEVRVSLSNQILIVQ